ncbi:MAG: hypothetical protein ACKO37_03390 [Vampirovibrionales bacterium]
MRFRGVVHSVVLVALYVWHTGACYVYAGYPSASPAVQWDYSETGVRGVILRAGTRLSVCSYTPLSTQSNKVGDLIEARLEGPVFVDDEKVLSKNTKLFGHIIQVEEPLQGRDAILKVAFDRLVQPDGQESTLKAHVVTENDDGVWGGEITPYTMPYYVTHRVWHLGEYNQLRYGGVRAMGKHLSIPVGDHWGIVLDEPIQLVVPISRPPKDPCPEEIMVRYDPIQGW